MIGTPSLSIKWEKVVKKDHTFNLGETPQG